MRRGVSYAGVLDRIAHEQFIELVRRHQGHYRPYRHGIRVGVLVIGTGDLPVTSSGDPLAFPATHTIDERRFLALLDPEADASTACFSMQSLADLLKVSPRRIVGWIRAGLIRPVSNEQGLDLFDLRQATIARTLLNLTAAGVTVAKLRESLRSLKQWLPTDEPLQQLAVLEKHGALLVRLETGELADVEGQLQIDFAEREPPVPSLRLRPAAASFGPQHLLHEQGVKLEMTGDLRAAEDCYRKALLAGGPDPQIAFDLAHLLAQRGSTEQAIERYQIATELAPEWSDAWNNLGLLLAEIDRLDEAVAALRRAITLSPLDAEARYNLSVLLGEVRRAERRDLLGDV